MTTDLTAQRRLVTQAKSKLTKVDIVEIMSKPEAWNVLSADTQARLYSLLPGPEAGDAPYVTSEHPLQSKLKEYIEAALLQWQTDLGEGRETKKFREHDVVTKGDDMPLEDSEEGSDYEATASIKK